MRIAYSIVLLLALPLACVAQTAAQKPQPLPPIPMPLDRVDDSYRIYSAIMPGGEFANPDTPYKLFLIRDVTLVMAPTDQPCASTPYNNPHDDIRPPADRVQEFAEVLADFDLHCHDRVQLTNEKWQLGVPYLLLSEEQQHEFSGLRCGAKLGNSDDLKLKYAGAPGLNSFSQVYFNAHHTLAMVYTTQWCGCLCGTSEWVVVELVQGQWKQRNWVTTFTI